MDNNERARIGLEIYQGEVFLYGFKPYQFILYGAGDDDNNNLYLSQDGKIKDWNRITIDSDHPVSKKICSVMNEEKYILVGEDSSRNNDRIQVEDILCDEKARKLYDMGVVSFLMHHSYIGLVNNHDYKESKVGYYFREKIQFNIDNLHHRNSFIKDEYHLSDHPAVEIGREE